MGQILFYYLEDTTGRYSLEELRTIQDWLIKYQLQTVPGVTEVLGIGGWEKQFQVEVLPNALLRYDVSLADVIDSIRANNLNVGAQFLERNDEELIVRSVGLATGIDDLERVVIKTVDGTPVFLRDLAEIRIGGAVRRGVQTRNGVGEVVAGQVIKLFGANSSTVIGDVEKKVEEVNRTLPEGVRIVPYYQQKSLVEAAVRTVTTALLVGIGLVVLVLPVFMGGARASLVVALAIPFSVLVAFIGMRLFGISANLMSFGGLAIAIGMMVDGTIVMVENIERKLRESKTGDDPARDRREAAAEVARPDLLRHPHHRGRLPAALHPPGRRGQDLPTSGRHRGDGHGGLADLRPRDLPGAGVAADAAARTGGLAFGERAVSVFGLPMNPASLLRQPAKARGRGGRGAGGRRRDPPAAARLRVHPPTPGGHPGSPSDHGAFDRAVREHPGRASGRAAPDGNARSDIGRHPDRSR